MKLRLSLSHHIVYITVKDKRKVENEKIKHLNRWTSG